MTTKTIPVYLEDERQKHKDDQLRIEAEATRIQPLHHGHHRIAKQRKVELPSPVEVVGKTRKTAGGTRRKPRAARKKATKARKMV
jgi:hypothetical protein